MKFSLNRTAIFVFFSIISSNLLAQEEEDRYVPDPNTKVQKKIAEWQDLKFGLLMHWGPYSQWGIVESWSICPEEYDWCKRTKGKNPTNYEAYKAEYEALPATFNPYKFNPGDWAKAAKAAGMKYVVFTTKHHDGFAMYDTRYSNYKVTDSSCAFYKNSKANIGKEIFDAFRQEGLWAGAYFSKPDWHCQDYWDPAYPPRDRNVNYDPLAQPQKWENYIQYTHNQVLELVKDYGKLDILWFDGGWVAKKDTQQIKDWYEEELKGSKNGYLIRKVVNQDIRMDELVEKVRLVQPEIIVVDRAVPGKNQNYLTPENRVPALPLPYPWESCIISGGGWAHTPNAQYMSVREGVHLLVDIVAKGGNLLLNIAPTPEGEWQQGAYELLKGYEAWMRINQKAIYNTKAIAPYKEKNICFTQNADKSVNLIYLAKENELTLPETISIEGIKPADDAVMNLLGREGRLNWKAKKNGFVITIPENIRKNPPCRDAWVIKVSKIEN